MRISAGEKLWVVERNDSYSYSWDELPSSSGTYKLDRLLELTRLCKMC